VPIPPPPPPGRGRPRDPGMSKIQVYSQITQPGSFSSLFCRHFRE
jgi:hypothetical protein